MRTTWFCLLSMFVTPFQVSAEPPAEAFGTLPDVYDAAISPDASQIALIVNADGEYAVRVLDFDDMGGPLRAVGFGDGVKPMWIRWVNNDRILVALFQFKLIGGDAGWVSFIHSLDANTMEGRTLIKPRGLLRQNNADVIDFLDADPDHILMAFSEEDQFDHDIQRVHVETGRSQRIKRGVDGVQSWYTDQTGEPRVGQGRRFGDADEFKWRLTIRDTQGDKWRSSDDYPGLSADTPIIGFNKNPDEMLIGHYGHKNTMGIYVYDLAAKKLGRSLFHDDTYDASSIVTNGNGEIIGARYIADEPETVLFGDYDTNLERMRKRFPDYNISFVDQSSDGSRLLFSTSNANDPGSLLLSDSETGRLLRLSHNRSYLLGSDMGSIVAVKYAARDGFEIPAYITLPPGIENLSDAKNIPTVILPHGGPYSRSYKRFDYFAQFFASRGYVVLQMNFRGSAGYGEDFEEAGRSNWVLMQEDVADATEWAIEQGIADPKRTCIAGWSYGGYTALMGAIKNPELYVCAVSIAGVTDLQNLVSDVSRYRFGETSAKKHILSGFEDKDSMQENSPLRRADELRVPLFLAHAEEDLNVHFDHFQQMKRALKKNPTRVDYLEVKNDDHFFSVQKNRIRLFVELDDFLESTIGASEYAK